MDDEISRLYLKNRIRYNFPDKKFIADLEVLLKDLNKMWKIEA